MQRIIINHSSFFIAILSHVILLQQTKPIAAEDIVVDGVIGEASPQISWANSYQDDAGNCWCTPNIDFAEGQRRNSVVPTIDGQWWTIPDVCAALGPGPGIVDGTTPLFNDIQCGRGPPAAINDELTCPGRVDLGTPDGCKQFGGFWDFEQANPSLATNRVLPRPADAHPDIVVVVDVVGMRNPRANWADSYSSGNECYCASTFDHSIGTYMVETPMGYMSVFDVCELLGPGPGLVDGVTPVYNDIQCGNGPPNNAVDEPRCPGRVDIGPEGCGHIGPKWNFAGGGGGDQTTPVVQVAPTTVPVAPSPPTGSPTTGTISNPTGIPTQVPTKVSTTSPPTQVPTKSPIEAPTPTPTIAPIVAPTQAPVSAITVAPVVAASPTVSPKTVAPIVVPVTSGPSTAVPIAAPITPGPTKAQITSPPVIAKAPTSSPSLAQPSVQPTRVVTVAPTIPPTSGTSPVSSTLPPTSISTTLPPISPMTSAPTIPPTGAPITKAPSTVAPTLSTVAPTVPSSTVPPTMAPIAGPTSVPVETPRPTDSPVPSPSPSFSPSVLPTGMPSVSPSIAPVLPLPIPLVKPVRTCTPSDPCDRCEGDCDSDSECMGTLVCFQKGNGEEGVHAVAGCLGDDLSRTDWCTFPELIGKDPVPRSVSPVTSMPSTSMPSTSTSRPTSPPSTLSPPFSGPGMDDSMQPTVPDEIPLQKPVRGCTKENPCQLCEGDCDKDEHCAGSLICFQRDRGFPGERAVPGCIGDDLSKTDWCTHPIYKTQRAFDALFRSPSAQKLDPVEQSSHSVFDMLFGRLRRLQFREEPYRDS